MIKFEVEVVQQLDKRGQCFHCVDSTQTPQLPVARVAADERDSVHCVDYHLQISIFEAFSPLVIMQQFILQGVFMIPRLCSYINNTVH